VRPTKDLDLTLKIASLAALEELRESIVARGFIQTADENVVCRFRYEDTLVDIMVTEAVGWAPGNRWFALGFNLAYTYSFETIQIKLLPLPYFLAAKFDAFWDRGIKDVLASHDFEDIVYLLNYSIDIVNEILQSENPVKEYLIECATNIIESKPIQEAIIGNLYYEAQEERFLMIMDKLHQLKKGD